MARYIEKMIETLKHKEAFEYYYSLGDKRSLKQLMQKYSVSIAALNNWSRAFDWQERVQIRDKNNALELEKRTDIKVVDDKAKMLSVVRAGINLFIENLKAGKVKVETIADLDRLIDKSLLLQQGLTAEQILEFLQVKGK